MNIQILPNWCKKLGIAIFLVGLLGLFVTFIISLNNSEIADGAYMVGYNAGKKLRELFEGSFFMGISIGRTIALATLLGMMTYLFSKEKVEDEYIAKLRLESYQLTFLIIVSFVFITFLLGGNMAALFVLYFFFGCYLLVFSLKKRFAA